MIKGKMFKQLLKTLQSLNIEDVNDDYKYDLVVNDDSIEINIYNNAGYYVNHHIYEGTGEN